MDVTINMIKFIIAIRAKLSHRRVRDAGNTTIPTHEWRQIFIVKNHSKFFAAFALSILPLHLSHAIDCESVPNSENAERRETVKKVCTDLPNALDFWIYGHEGHYPLNERSKNEAKMKRFICTDGKREVAVGAIDTNSRVKQVELFCLASDRREDGNAVGAFNKILEDAMANNGPISLISSDNPSTQNFYKSLNMDCLCEPVGAAGKGGDVRVMKFTTSIHPIKKKERYLFNDQRVLFDSCMSMDTFSVLGDDSELDAANGRDPKETVKFSTIANGALAPDYGKRWLSENPTTCK